MNTNFFIAEDEVFNPNKVLTRKEMDAFIGDRGIKSYAGVLKRDNKLFFNFIRVKVAEGKNCVDAIYARKAIVSNGCLRNDFFLFWRVQLRRICDQWENLLRLEELLQRTLRHRIHVL